MCCNRINADILMANLFAESHQFSGQSSEVKFSIDQLNEYFKFISDQFPVYVASNFSKQAVDECVSRYPAYYQFEEDDNEVIKSGEKYPDLDFFNAIYSESVSRYISRITQKYLDKIKK